MQEIFGDDSAEMKCPSVVLADLITSGMPLKAVTEPPARLLDTVHMRHQKAVIPVEKLSAFYRLQDLLKNWNNTFFTDVAVHIYLIDTFETLVVNLSVESVSCNQYLVSV